MSQLLIGAGGWAYFQVPGMDSLEAYSQAFNFVELNSSYYELPSVSSASDWRKRVPADFRYSVRCPRIMVDHYGLKLLPGSRGFLARLEEVCKQLEAEVMTVLISASSPIKGNELATRLSDFLGAFGSHDTLVAVEFRGMRPSQEVLDVMKESGAIHSVDLSTGDPLYEGRILYSRLFGRGEENIYEFDDAELTEIAKKASPPKFEKSILAFHGVRMYRDAGRVKSFIDKGYFPKITSGVGTDSIREVLSEDAQIPNNQDPTPEGSRMEGLPRYRRGQEDLDSSRKATRRRIQYPRRSDGRTSKPQTHFFLRCENLTSRQADSFGQTTHAMSQRNS